MLKKLISLAMAVAVLGSCAGVQAGMIYDFNNLTPGQALHNQDGWTYESGGTDLAKASNTAATGWLGTGVYVQAGASGGTTANYKKSTVINWLVNNQDFDVSALTYDTPAHTDAGLVALGDATNIFNTKKLFFGVTEDQFNTHRLGFIVGDIWNNNTPAAWLYHTLPSWDAPKTLKVGCYFTAKGNGVYEMQRYYINMTDAPATVNNIGTPFTSIAIPDLNVLWTECRLYTNAAGKIDNIRIDQVPEPGTLALLAAGLVGLLAYAWRKRR